MGAYLPIVAMVVLGVAFAGLSILVSRLLAPKRTTAAKLGPYESGIVPTLGPPERFPVRFFLVAMIFIVFDVELIFLYPWAVTYRELGAFGLGAMALFAAIVFVSFVYDVAVGALDWGPGKRDPGPRPEVSPTRTAATTVRRVGLDGREEAA